MMIIKKVSAVLAVLALCLVFAGAALAAETGGAKPVLKGTAAKAATAAKAMKPVNINKATAAELAALDGVGPGAGQEDRGLPDQARGFQEARGHQERQGHRRRHLQQEQGRHHPQVTRPRAG